MHFNTESKGLFSVVLVEVMNILHHIQNVSNVLITVGQLSIILFTIYKLATKKEEK